jgi:hypothetical protein
MSKCTMCGIRWLVFASNNIGKTVYAAEKQSYEGKEYHIICLGQYTKTLKAKVRSHQITNFNIGSLLVIILVMKTDSLEC